MIGPIPFAGACHSLAVRSYGTSAGLGGRVALIDMVDRMFGGSVEALVMNLLKTRQLDPKKLRELKEVVRKQRQEDTDGDD